MRKKTPFIIEASIGLILTLLVSWATLSGAHTLGVVSLKTYDLLSRLSTRFTAQPPSADAVRIVAIDEEALLNLGRWPWPRSLTGQLVDEIAHAGAGVVGLNLSFSDPSQNYALYELEDLRDTYESLLQAHLPLMKQRRIDTLDFEAFAARLEESRYVLDEDAALARAIDEATNVVLPMYFDPGDHLGAAPELPAFFAQEGRPLTDAGDGRLEQVPSGRVATLPLEIIGERTLAIGHVNLETDVDGTLRRIAPVIRYGNAHFPSFGLQLAREHWKLQRDTLAVRAGTGLALYKAVVPWDEFGKTFVRFPKAGTEAKAYSALDVLTGGIPENAFKDKIVLVGVTGPGGAPLFITPGGQMRTGLALWAAHIDNLLTQRFIYRPPWTGTAEWGSIALAALLLIGVLPFVRARFAVPLAAVLFLGLLGASWTLFAYHDIWMSPAYGGALLAIGFTAVVGRRLVFTERRKEMVEAEGMETNKMLGLSFQGQGMLDLAFEKFRKCHLDEAMSELLYNLGLDMERKRQFAKAAAVYDHIATAFPKYKDVQEKMTLLKKAGEGAVFGSVGRKGSDSTVVVEGLGQFTTLGRYEIIKELGRGAMGIVYLGRDPKINRQVAIKTLRFGDEVDEEQMKSVKERFFREAESAGSLTHPNIIRIFDAGEDQDVAYIAMELIAGDDLKKYCDKSHMLSFERVVELMAHVAEGLAFAHNQGVVHRDIKPGNLMLLRDNTLRITDFGIARIQATSKTATGAVLGTPAYMSPEQVNGKKVDGRADIFSLGVTLFELLSGEKPFQADSIAALLYRIANVEHPDVREYNPALPAEVVPIISKALAKDPDNRYQSAADMALDLRGLLTKSPKTAGSPAVTLEIEKGPAFNLEPQNPRPDKEADPASPPGDTAAPSEEMAAPTPPTAAPNKPDVTVQIPPPESPKVPETPKPEDVVRPPESHATSSESPAESQGKQDATVTPAANTGSPPPKSVPAALPPTEKPDQTAQATPPDTPPDPASPSANAAKTPTDGNPLAALNRTPPRNDTPPSTPSQESTSAKPPATKTAPQTEQISNAAIAGTDEFFSELEKTVGTELTKTEDRASDATPTPPPADQPLRDTFFFDATETNTPAADTPPIPEEKNTQESRSPGVDPFERTVILDSQTQTPLAGDDPWLASLEAGLTQGGDTPPDLLDRDDKETQK